MGKHLKYVNITRMCLVMGLSRAAYYKAHSVRERRETNEERILSLVRKQRKLHPRMGGRKLYHRLGAELDAFGIGRDRFFDLLRRKNLLVPKRRRQPRTTNSDHGWRTHPNLLKNQQITGPHQAWVSDITYISTEEGYLYLALTTDAGSRKIVGHHASDTLEAEGCILALRQAQRQLPQSASPLHHSDRGCQYCSKAYIKQLRVFAQAVSMTEENHCYENAMAERINGILKHEYALTGTFRTKAEAIQAINQAINLYNYDRPHMMLGYSTPDQAHSQTA